MGILELRYLLAPSLNSDFHISSLRFSRKACFSAIRVDHTPSTMLFDISRHRTIELTAAVPETK